MGFFDGLTSMAKNAFSYDWSKTWKNLWDNGAQNVYHGFLTTAATAFNGALTPDLWGADGAANRQRLSDALGQMGQGVSGLAAGVGSLPVIRQVGEVGSWASNEIAKRPLGTFSLMAGDAANGKASLFSGDAWRQAYDDTRYSSFGQAYEYATSSVGFNLDKLLRIYDYTNPDDRAWLKAHAPWVPDWATSPDGYDPRQAIAHERYLNSPWVKFSSGSLDAGADILADPTRGVGAAARAGKLRYWSGVMDSAATNKLVTNPDRWQSFVDSRRYQRTYNFIQNNADTPQGVERIRQTIFNNHVNGGVMANALADVSQDPHLYNLTWRALYGDPDAWGQLTSEAPRIADMTGSKYANFSISQVAKNYGIPGQENADNAASNLVETKTQAFADAMANGHGMWGKVGRGVQAGGLLTGQAMPTLRLASQWRTGVNQLLNFGPNTIFGNWFGPANYTLSSITRLFLPSSRGGRHLDLNNPDSLRIFRNNLLQSRLDQGQVDNWVNAYSRASSPESRFNVVNLAENAAFKQHAITHGVSANDVEAILPQLNKFRAYNRAFVNSNKRFIPSDALKLAEQYRAQGMTDEADRVAAVGNSIDQSVKNGTFPSSVIASLDQDGNLAYIPLDSSLDPSRPVLLSQTQDTHVLQDWGALDSALWWRNKGPLGTGIWQTKEAVSALADAASGVWKISAILRPGYLWRPLTDEAGGPLSVMGAFGSIAATTEGTSNAFWNTINRGALMGQVVRDAVTKDKLARLAGKGRKPVEATVDSEAPSAGSELAISGTHPDLPGYVFGTGLGYQSYDHAVADGLISVPDFMRRLAEHGENGNLPEAYQAIHNSIKEGLITPKEGQQFALDEALASAGRNAYQSPSWQQAVIQSAIDARADKGSVPGVPVSASPFAKGAEPGPDNAGLVVDPMSGASPKIESGNIPPNFSLGNTVRIPAQLDQFDGVYKYIHANADQLLAPGSLLHAYVQPDGNLALSVASLKPESTLDAVKPSAGVRVGIPFSSAKGKPLRASGMTGFDVMAGGRTYHILGSFEGQKGELFQKQVSTKGTTEAWVDRMSDTQKARLMAMAPDQWRNVNSDDAGYDLAWERAVMQLGNDPVARQFLRGDNPDQAASHSDVVAWMHNTDQGRAYQYRLGPYLPQYYDQIHLVHGMTDTYVPFNPDRPDESAALRQKVLDGTASFKDLQQVVSKDQMPQVHGATLAHATGVNYFTHLVRKWTSDAFRFLGDMPNDTFLRYPMANERYQTYVNQFVQSRSHWLNGEEFSQGDLDAVQGLARERALVDVRKYLYDSMATSDLARGLRLFIPFGSALYDSAAKWGTVLRENPGRIAPLWRIWSAPDTNGMIQDSDGNHLEVQKDGTERWWYANPQTGEKTYQPSTFVPNGKNIVFRLPTGVKVAGANVGVSITKQAFQTFLDMPTFGPLVAVPANNFALQHPEWANNQFVKTFILPYGPSSNGASAAVPGNVRNWKDAWDTFVAHKDTENSENQALQIWSAEMVAYSQGKRNNAPTFEEARQKAAQLAGLRFISRLSGATASFTTPYQPYVDYYHILEAKPRKPTDPTADEEFYKTMGPEFFWLTSRVTQNALGIPATLQSDAAYKKYADLMQQFPDLAPLIEGAEGAGAFSKAVYEAQKATPIRYGTQTHERQLLTLEQSAEDVQKRLGWVKYTQFTDALHADMAARGVTNLNQKGAEDLAQTKQDFLDNNMFWVDPYGAKQVSPWFQDYSTTDQSKIESRLTQMRQIVQDSRLSNRDDIRGLIDYLDSRDQFKAYMTSQGIGQLSSKDKKSLPLYNQWADYVFGLKESNLSFAQLYDRWLAHDETLAAE